MSVELKKIKLWCYKWIYFIVKVDYNYNWSGLQSQSITYRCIIVTKEINLPSSEQNFSCHHNEALITLAKYL